MAEQVEATEKTSKMAQLLEKIDFSPHTFARGERVEGKIVSRISDNFLIDIGAKAEGIIPTKELETEQKGLKEGDSISTTVAQPENDSGIIILTVKKDLKDAAWGQLQKVQEKGETVEVRGIEANRGGLIVEYNENRGFVPSSHLSTNSRDAIGKKLLVKPIEVNRSFNKLVFSEKEVVGDSLPKVDLPFKVGDSLDVNISKMLPFGLLVSLKGGIEGLVHISEISWTRVENLQDAFKIGQNIKIKVISIDPSSGRVNLSIKQLEKDPWIEAAKKYTVGTVFERKISRTANYGVFVALEEGIEGLLHSSKIPYGRDLKVGEKIEVSIDLFNAEQRRVALRLANQQEPGDNKGKERKKQPASKVKTEAIKEAKKTKRAEK